MKPATPLPWKYERRQAGRTVIHHIFGGKVLAPFDMAILEKRLQGTSLATNADLAYIAHACNLYPELTELLEEATWAMIDVLQGGDLRGLPVTKCQELLRRAEE